MFSRISLLGTVLLVISSVSHAYIVDGSRVNQPRLLSYAKDALQNQGTIQQNPNGFTYVRVPDSYITDLLQKVARPGFGVPSYTQRNAVHGAHIVIMTEEETKNIKGLPELGQTVQFKPLGFYTIVIHDKEYFMLAVDAPELSELRKKYGLSEKLDNHAFHLTIGVRHLTAENELASADELASSKN